MRAPALAGLCAGFLVLSACAVGPNYKKPAAVTPPAFKEQPPVDFKEAEAQGWKQSQPGDAFLKGKWWEIYNDAELNALEEQVNLSNQNVLQAEAQYRQAKAEVSVARSALFPIVATTPSANVSRTGSNATSGNGGGINNSGTSGAGNSGTTSASTRTRTAFSLPLNASWEPDIWGNLRRGVSASAATAQSFAADLENARLLYQAELAQDYFQLHSIDAEADLLKRTESSYQENLTLTQNRLNGGVATDLDVAQAESQLYDVQSELLDLGVQRTQFEHSIAILTGKPPSELTIPAAILATVPPPVPVGTPSELLQRRPDIASAERRVAAANEQIGIAMAAFYPSLTVSGDAGFQSTVLGKLLSAPSRFWSVGPQLAETLFDAGRRRGIVTEQRAAYDATVAGYRDRIVVRYGDDEAMW